jgi:hypothetical protein
MFFSHENQPNPPSLSVDGNIRLGSKADLLSCLENVAEISTQDLPEDQEMLDTPLHEKLG